MHKSKDPDKQIAAVNLYLDESGGQDPNTPVAVVAGILINRSHYQPFEDSWEEMLQRYGMEPPLHMKEFGRPHGRFAVMTDVDRHELFAEATELINAHKIASIAAKITNAEYEAHVPQEVRDKFSAYGMCFNLAAVMNHQLAEHNSYKEKIAFFLDIGNPYASHVVKAHAAMYQTQQEHFLHVGPLSFDDDKDFGVLQAADVIAWGTRRRASGIALDYPFNPIMGIFGEEHHAEASWESHLLKGLADGLMLRMAEAKERTE